MSLWTGNTVTTYQKEDAVGIALSVSGREVVLVGTEAGRIAWKQVLPGHDGAWLIPIF